MLSDKFTYPVGEFGILIESGEVLRMRSPRKYRNRNAVMTLCRIIDLDALFADAASKKRHSSCSMVCRHYHQGLTVLGSPLESDTYRAVKVDDLLHGDSSLI